MNNIKLFFIKIKHSLFGCPDEDLHYINKSYAVCSACGKKHFIFTSY